MLGVLGTEAVQQCPHPVRPPVVVRISRRYKIGRLGQKHPALPKAKAVQQVQAVKKHSMPISHTIAVPILENHNRIRRLLPWQRMGPSRGVAHPQTTARIELDRHRVRDGKVCLRGEQIDLIARRHLHHRQLRFRGFHTPGFPVLLHRPDRLRGISGYLPGCGRGKPDRLPIHRGLSPDVGHSRFLRLPDSLVHVFHQLTGLRSFPSKVLCPRRLISSSMNIGGVRGVPPQLVPVVFLINQPPKGIDTGRITLGLRCRQTVQQAKLLCHHSAHDLVAGFSEMNAVECQPAALH